MQRQESPPSEKSRLKTKRAAMTSPVENYSHTEDGESEAEKETVALKGHGLFPLSLPLQQALPPSVHTALCLFFFHLLCCKKGSLIWEEVGK